MVLLIAVAVLGAALGAYVRPRPVAVVLALVLGGAARAGFDALSRLIERTAAPPAWLTTLDDLITPPGVGYLALIAVCGAGALFAVLLCLVLNERPHGAFWLPKEGDVRRRDRAGRYRRVAEMVEDRPAQNDAEARFRSAYER